MQADPRHQGRRLKVVQNLPGVARAPFGIGLLVVRGGKPWDTRTYVDEAPVPQLFHFGGLFATYNSSLLEDISASSPATSAPSYGRNIGGLVARRRPHALEEGLPRLRRHQRRRHLAARREAAR